VVTKRSTYYSEGISGHNTRKIVGSPDSVLVSGSFPSLLAYLFEVSCGSECLGARRCSNAV
jgi:hypothetical protein